MQYTYIHYLRRLEWQPGIVNVNLEHSMATWDSQWEPGIVLVTQVSSQQPRHNTFQLAYYCACIRIIYTNMSIEP